MKKKVKTAWAQVERLHLKYDIQNEDDVAKMTETEQKSYAAHLETIKSHIANQSNFDATRIMNPLDDPWFVEYFSEELDDYKDLEFADIFNYPIFSAAITRNFWRTEYLKRKFFVDQQNSKTAAEELPAYKALVKWRKKREERIGKGIQVQDCSLDCCHFNKPASSSHLFLPYPFFYNTDCPECPFKAAIKETIITIHNVKHPDQPLNSLAQIANSAYSRPWGREFTTIASRLHGLSYKYGLFAHDLFGLGNPEEILKGTPIRFCDTFIQQDKSVVPEWINVTNNFPPEVNITQNDIFCESACKYDPPEPVIGVEI